MTLKDDPPRSACAQHATGEEQRNSSRSNEEGESKQKQCPAVDVSGGESKVRCCKEQYCIGTWNVRSINRGTSGQTGDGNNEHHHLGISELKWTRMGKLIQMSIISTNVGKDSLEEME